MVVKDVFNCLVDVGIRLGGQFFFCGLHLLVGID